MKNFKFPLLKAEDIEVRVNKLIPCYGENEQGEKITYYKADLLLYKNARVDMNYLDNYVGAFRWQRSHRTDGTDFICILSIYDDDRNCWVSKEDVGEFSNVAAQKGRASDAFKRAATNWGIGRELYTAPRIVLQLKAHETYLNNKTKNVALSNSVSFVVSEIEYTNNVITALVIKDNLGNYRFAYPDAKRKEVYHRINAAKQVAALVDASAKAVESLPEIIPVKATRAEETPPVPKPKQTPPPKDDDTKNMCMMCGVGISGTMAAISRRKVNKTVCLKCREKILNQQRREK